jgi:excisionase family DNA binding protein
MLPPSARPPIWDEFAVDLGEDVTPDEARAFVRLVNRPEGQAFLWKVAESLVQLRRAKKRRRLPAAAGPVIDPAGLPFLLTVQEAAGLLRTTVDGVYARIERGQLSGVEGLVREGRKVLFHRDKLVRSLERAGDGRATRGGRR